MQVDVLGPTRIIAGGQEVSLPGQRPKDVLATLLLRRGQPVSAEVILDLVWADGSAQLSASAVHTVVARLRRALGAHVVRKTPAGYQLAAVRTDEERFTDLVVRGRQEAAAGRTEASVTTLVEALGLWRGPRAFSDISDDLVVAERARLEELRWSATEELAAGHLDLGSPSDVEQARSWAATVIADQPLRERAYRLAMLASYRAGRQAEALELYRQLRRVLRSDLGVEPSPATATLHNQVLAHDPALSEDASAGRARISPRPNRVASMPIPAAPIIGREHELDLVLTSLANGRRLVTLIGPGGVGKTRLLAEVGARLRGDTDIVYLDVAALGEVEPDQIAQAIGRAAGVPASGADPIASLAANLHDRGSVLLLADEAEWAVEATASLVTELLAGIATLSIVVTSRSPLNVVGERRVLVAPLACPQPDDAPDQIRTAPAVRLLLDRIADHAEVEVGEEDLETVATITRRVEGLPLAIELLAGYAGACGLHELLALTEAPLELAGAQHGRTARHRTLRDALAWSVQRLSIPQRTALRRLAVFVGGFEFSSARAVIGPVEGEVTDILRRLVADALLHVERHASGTRLRMLRTVRDLAREELSAAGELESTRARHRTWFARRWPGAPLTDDVLHDVRVHHDDYVEALRSALDSRDALAVGSLALALTRLWVFTEDAGPGLRWVVAAIDSGLLDRRDQARMQIQRGILHMPYHPQEAIGWIEAAAQVARELDDAEWLVTAQLQQAVHRFEGGDAPAALSLAQECLVTARHSAPTRQAQALSLVAAMAAASQDHDLAVASAEEAWLLGCVTGSASDVAAVAGNTALALLESGQGERACEVVATAQRLVEGRIGAQSVIVLCVNGGWAAISAGDYAAALACFAGVLTDHPEADSNRWAAETYLGASCALAGVGSAAAAQALPQACELVRRVGPAPSHWQARQVERAREAAGVSPGTPADVQAHSIEQLGGRLRRLIIAAAREHSSG